MTLEEFNSKYTYKSDKEKYQTNFDIWEIPREVDGRFEGDCESYARLLKNRIEQFKDWEYYYCKLNGDGHCILYKNGDVIDCNAKKVVSLEQYMRMYSVTELKKQSVLMVVGKVLFSKGFLLWKKLFKN